MNREYNFAIVLLPAPCSPMNKVHFLNSTYADSIGPTFCILRVVISFIVLTDVIDIITNLMVCQCKDSAKIVQTESRTSSLFECYAEVQPILCKDNEFNSILHYQ